MTKGILIMTTTKIDGHWIIARVSALIDQSKEYADRFAAAQKAFPTQVASGEVDNIDELDAAIMRVEAQLAAVQGIQAEYNATTMVAVPQEVQMPPVMSRIVSLKFLVSYVGAIGRAAGRWREAAAGGKRERFYGGQEVLNPDEEVRTYQKSPTQASTIRRGYYAKRQILNALLHRANSTEMDVDSELYEFITQG